MNLRKWCAAILLSGSLAFAQQSGCSYSTGYAGQIFTADDGTETLSVSTGRLCLERSNSAGGQISVLGLSLNQKLAFTTTLLLQ